MEPIARALPFGLFDETFRRRRALLAITAEEDAHREFLMCLFIACSPLRDILSMPLLQQQAIIQLSSHRSGHPDAMRRVVLQEGEPIGRIVVDWSLDPVLGVDIAVLPDRRSSGAGLSMLRAWVDVTDQQQRWCRLSVLRDNPAAQLYSRLGFEPDGEDDGGPVVSMLRAPTCRAL